MRLTYAPAGALAAKELAVAAEAAAMAPRHANFLPPRAFVWSLALHLLALAWLTGPQGTAVRAQLPRLPLLATLRLALPATPAATAPQAPRPLPRAASHPASHPASPGRVSAEPTPASPAPSIPVPPIPAPAAPASAATDAAATKDTSVLDAAAEELALASYGRSLADALAHQRPYPPLAALRGWQGEVRVRVQVARKGAIVAVQLLHSSGYGVLDADAVQLVQQAEPLPSPPQILQGREFQVVVPILYKLERAA